MPSSVAALFDAARVSRADKATWGERPLIRAPGVYAVSVTGNAGESEGPGLPAPISESAIAELLAVRPELTLDGRRPTPDALRERLAEFWAPDEPVLYVGLAGTSLSKRVSDYYKTPLGARRPHAGGWFLKTLTLLPRLYVHYGPSEDVGSAEDALLGAYCRGISDSTRSALRDPDHPFPFANLEWPPGIRKAHGIKGAREPHDGRRADPGAAAGA